MPFGVTKAGVRIHFLGERAIRAAGSLSLLRETPMTDANSTFLRGGADAFRDLLVVHTEIIGVACAANPLLHEPRSESASRKGKVWRIPDKWPRGTLLSTSIGGPQPVFRPYFQCHC